MKKNQGRAFLILASIIILTTLSSGCLGVHKKCSECDGKGYKVIYEGWQETGFQQKEECKVSNGDGEVGIFIKDEFLEDIISWALLAGILIALAWLLIRPQLVILQSPSSIRKTSATLDWTRYRGLGGKAFNVYRIIMGNKKGLSDGNCIATITDRSNTTYRAKDLSPMTTYYFRIDTTLKNGGTNQSNVVSVRTKIDHAELELQIGNDNETDDVASE